MIAGIDYSTRFVDVVLLDEDSDAAEWYRVGLDGQDAFDRARDVMYLNAMLGGVSFWDSVVAIGIENPGGNFGTSAMYRIQGAILAELPRRTLVQPFPPAQWRKTIGLPGNASKDAIRIAAFERMSYTHEAGRHYYTGWPQDACDAYCIALATRTLIQVTA